MRWHYTIVRHHDPKLSPVSIYEGWVEDELAARAAFDMLTSHVSGGMWKLAWAQHNMIVFDNGPLRATLKRS